MGANYVPTLQQAAWLYAYTTGKTWSWRRACIIGQESVRRQWLRKWPATRAMAAGSETGKML